MSLKPLLLRAGTALLRSLPSRVTSGVALASADVCWLALSHRRRTIARNLDVLAVDRPPAERRRLVHETFRNLARCSLHFLALPLLEADDVMALVEWRGLEYLNAALARGRGVLLITGHLGNWELAGAAIAARGSAFYGYAEDTGVPARTFAAYERYRSATGARVIPVSRGAFAGCRALREGAVLMMVADRVFGAEGVPVRFGKGRRRLPRGPAVLLRRSGATPLVMTVTLQAGARPYRGVVAPLPLDPGASDACVTQAIADRLSEAACGHPDQWFVFDPGWLASGLEQQSM